MRIIFLIALLFYQAVFACEVIDDKGNLIRMAKPASRIVSLAPDLTENLFAVGAGDQIVGVMQGSDYPNAAKQIPIVGSYHRIDQEAIAAMRPDLIVVWSDVNFLSQLKRFKVPVYHSRPKTFSDIPKTLKHLGCLTGHEKKANEVAAAFTRKHDDLVAKYLNKSKVTVFYQVWSHPLMTITQESWINSAIDLCGGKNIFATLKGVAPEVDRESVMALNPAVIFGMETDHHWQNRWKSWSRLQAVQLHHLYSLDPDLMSRATSRLLDGTRDMCEWIAKARN